MKHSDRTINRHNGGSSIKVYWKKQALTIMTLFMLAGLSGCSGGETLKTESEVAESTEDIEDLDLVESIAEIENDDSMKEYSEDEYWDDGTGLEGVLHKSVDPWGNSWGSYKYTDYETLYRSNGRNELKESYKIVMSGYVTQMLEDTVVITVNYNSDDDYTQAIFNSSDAPGKQQVIVKLQDDYTIPYGTMYMEGDVITVYGATIGNIEVSSAIKAFMNPAILACDIVLEDDIFPVTQLNEMHAYNEAEATGAMESSIPVTEYQEMPTNPYSDSILLWKSYYETLTNADCKGLSKSELRIARNEIYAAYGRIFTSQDLIDYFSSKSWYQGTIPAEQFNDSVLTEIQKYNIRLIQSYEDGAEGGEDYQSRGLAVYDAEAIPQLDGEYTYVDDNDDSRYVTLSIDGYEASLLFYSAFGMSEEMTGFYGVNDIEYWNDSSSVILRFNDYGRQMVYVSGDGSEFTYTFSH